MREELHEYLDGERALEDLPPELRERAEAWERRIEDFRERSDRPAPPWVRPKVLRRIREEAPAGWRQWVRWALVPVAAAALAVAVWMGPWQEGGAPSPDEARQTTSAEKSEAVTDFRFEAPEAERVAVAGSFTDWRPTLELKDPDGDGVWTGSVPLAAGVHQYMFVVDGEKWVTDPNADRYVADGFGNRNAVVAVAP